MYKKVFDRIDEMSFTATKTERELIKGLKTIPINELIYMSITDLAEQLGMAEATILRFCRKLDYKGFQDFKLTLSRDYAFEKPNVTEQTKAQQIMTSMCEGIAQTNNEMEYTVVKSLASNIIKARKVCIFGVGNSYISSVSARNRLIKAGIIAENSSDTHSQTMITANLSKEDLVILISASGGTIDIIHIAEIAKENGTPIAVITNYAKSPLAKFATYLLTTSKKEAAYEGGSLATVVSQLFIVDVLCAEVFDILGDKALETSSKASNAVSIKSL